MSKLCLAYWKSPLISRLNPRACSCSCSEQMMTHFNCNNPSRSRTQIIKTGTEISDAHAWISKEEQKTWSLLNVLKKTPVFVGKNKSESELKRKGSLSARLSRGGMMSVLVGSRALQPIKMLREYPGAFSRVSPTFSTFFSPTHAAWKHANSEIPEKSK